MEFKSRRERTREAHDFTTKEEKASTEQSIRNEEKRQQEKLRKKKILETEFSYRIVKLFATVMDDWCLDPILGIVFPEAGDTVSLVMSLPYLYVSIFKIKSFALTVVVLKNILFDYLIGLIPLLGDVLDFFVRSYRDNYRLIVGYVEDDKEIIRKVRKSAFMSTIAVLVLFVLIGLALSLIFKLIGKIIS